MPKFLILSVVFLFSVSLTCLSQSSNLKTFVINGQVNVDTGTVLLSYGESNKVLYPESFKPAQTKIKDGRFTFTGKVADPIWVSFKIGQNYSSESTAIVPGSQNISIDTALRDQKPTNSNFVMKDVAEYDQVFIPFEKKYRQYRLEYDSLLKIYGTKFPDDVMLQSTKNLKATYVLNDSLLLSFVKSHPNSHYALFRLKNLLTFGYTETLGETYQSLSASLKNSPHGKLTEQLIAASKPVSVGARIPGFNVEDLKGGALDSLYFKKNKYTLIDMWYSHCMPCIASFDDYKRIRNANLSKGFEIIGISTDQTKFVEDWKSVIAKYELPWPQYLDLNGVEAKKYNIKIYPTTFLVNQTGEIVATGLSPVELKDFLERHL